MRSPSPGSRPIHFGSNIFFPRSSLSAIFLSAFSHRPDWATRFSHRPRHGHLVIPHSDAGFRNIGKGHPALRRGIQRIPASLLVRFSFLDPASLCGVTPLVIPRFDAVSRNIWGGESPRCYSSYAMNWTPHHVRGDVPGYAAPRRSIQEIEAREYSLSMRLEYST